MEGRQRDASEHSSSRVLARIIHVGRTSITVDVQVYAGRNPAQPIVVKVTEAQLTFVALDAVGKKRVVPPER